MPVQVLRESKVCPNEYTEFLVRIGGLNPFGRPNFRLVWGESATNTIWGQMEDGSCGQHVKLRYGGIPRWNLEMWKPAEMFGSPEQWYAESYDPITGYHVCGDYPFQGDYCHHTRLHALNFAILEELIPKIDKARGMTFSQRKAIIEAEMEAEKQDRLKRGKDAYLDASPAFGGVAGTYESNRERWMQRIQEKQKGMKLTAEQLRIGGTQDKKKWALQNPKLSQEEIDRRVIGGYQQGQGA
jgi:hypothetical protein